MMLDSLFSPSSIAVIGASNNPNKWGHVVLKRIVESGYDGDIYPVNIKEKIIEIPSLNVEMDAYKDISFIKNDIDMAIIAIPSDSAIKITGELCKNNVKNIVMLSAGFSETLTERGINKELLLKGIIDKYDANLLGPNTLGFINTDIKLNASIIPYMPKTGGLSFISQSGSMGLAIMKKMHDEDVGIDIMVSVGNQLDIDYSKLIDYMDCRNATDAIFMHIEGIKHGMKFIKSARNCSKKIYCMKTGITDASFKAVSSHTGALAGSDAVYNGIFEQFGIKRIYRVQQIFDIAQLVTYLKNKSPSGNRVGVFSCGGGAGIITFDNLTELLPARFSGETIDAISNIIPSFGSSNNPIDSAAASDYDTYYNSLKVLCRDSNIDLIITIYVDGGFIDIKEPQNAVIDAERECGKPIIYCQFANDDIKKVRNAGIPSFTDIEEMCDALNLYFRGG